VERNELAEFHYITPIVNLVSIVNLGILSHNRAEAVAHASVAMAEIQDLRANKAVPNGRQLHDYANLYFHARNAMMYKRRAKHEELCVIKVSSDVLDLPNVIVSDSNAAANDHYVRFAAAPDGLRIVNRQETYAESWNSPNYYEKCRLRSKRCAEVLVPDRVEPNFLMGVYVSGEAGLEGYTALELNLPAIIDRHLFFR
jgi:hypothetical protein